MFVLNFIVCLKQNVAKDYSCICQSYSQEKISSPFPCLLLVNFKSASKNQIDFVQENFNGYGLETKCTSFGLLTCHNGKCYNISDICVYNVDSGKITPCQNGDHLFNCENIECNMHFKCPGAYCIPWSYVCDGTWDWSRGI